MARRRSAFGSWLLGPADQSPRQLRVRVQLLLTTMLVTTNVIGAAVVAALSLVIIPGAAPNRSMAIALAIAVPVYVLVAVLFGATYGTIRTVRALRWVPEGRKPSDRERQRALQLPWRLSVMQLLLWALALAVFTPLAVIHQPAAVLSTAAAIVIAGLVVSTIAYLLSEFVLRPISARALAGQASADLQPQGLGVRGRLLSFWAVGTAAPTLGLVLAAVIALVHPETSSTQLAVVVLGLTAVILLFGLLVTALTARSMVAPIGSVRQALARVGNGDLDVDVVVYDGTELGLLQAGFNDMVHGLREREEVRDLFGRQVGREVAAAAERGEIRLGGETQVVSVLMIDLIGSTGYATEHDPADVVTVLNRFFTVVVEEVDRHHGLVNKFMGDAVLAIFGAPVHEPRHATFALSAARAMARRLTEDVPEIGAGIGVATGEAVAGNIGDTSRFEYTVIGDAVNSAARLTELAKEVPGRVLVSWATVEDAEPDEQDRWERDEPKTLRGRSEPTEVAVLREA
jgi:adenylate cyclase